MRKAIINIPVELIDGKISFQIGMEQCYEELHKLLQLPQNVIIEETRFRPFEYEEIIQIKVRQTDNSELFPCVTYGDRIIQYDYAQFMIMLKP